MKGGTYRFPCFAVLIVLILSCQLVCGLPPGFCLPEENAYALGVFAPQTSSSGEEPILLDEILEFQDATGKKPTIGVFSDEWRNDRSFPLQGVTTLRNEGLTPYIRLMMRSSETPYQQEPLYTLNNIALGKFDGELRGWARDARAFGSPIIIEYGTEINQWNYPWNGYWNGAENGPDLYIDAYQHIISVMEEEGASNLIWVYHINADSQPNESWNNLTKYYPGDDYVNLVAVSLYGARKPFDTNIRDFETGMEQVKTALNSASIHKPIMLITGSDMRNQNLDPGTWITNVTTSLAEHSWPELKGLIWLNAAWKNDENALHDTTMRLQDNPSVSTAFRTELQKLTITDRLSCI